MLKKCKTQIQGTLLELHRLVYEHNKEFTKQSTLALQHHFVQNHGQAKKIFLDLYP